MRCRFEREGWRCPLESVEGEDYCYWHLPEDGKNPDDGKLKELKENEIMYVYLARANLSGKDLKGAFLAGANLRWANLQGSYLMRANLQGADLMWANLQGSKLEIVNFRGACLQHANLHEVNFWSSNLQGADLSHANLQGAHLLAVNLQGANLEEANLQGANLEHAELKQANLVCVRVNSDTSLNGADLRLANLYLSYLDETKTLRNAIVGKYDVNEIIANLTGRKNYVILNFHKIEEEMPEVASKLMEFAYYVRMNEKIIIFDKKKRKFIKLNSGDGREKSVKNSNKK